MSAPWPLSRPGALLRRLWMCLACLALAPAVSAQQAALHVDGGLLQGVALDARISVYRGIPYAAAPVGALRWRPPQPVVPWTGVRAADRFGDDCLQIPMTDPPGPGYVNQQSEDCLFLNVWAPNASSARPRPVMVWIHGGAWLMGAGSWPLYDGTAFARQGIVLVTLNYRLGRFGVFPHPTLGEESRRSGEPWADYGLMDQVAALRWVRDNIAAFGGDPGNVTIFGESAGGRSVNMLLTSQLARGLFHKAIAQSGGGQTRLESVVDPLPGGGLPEVECRARDWARAQGVTNDADPAALRRLPADVVARFDPRDPLPEPVVDGQVLPMQVDLAMARGLHAQVPYLAGSNSYEQGLLRWMPGAVQARLHQEEAFVPRIEAAYGAQGPARDAALAQWWGEAGFNGPARAFARAMAAAGNPAWLYRFAYVAHDARGTAPGAVHGAEEGMVFHNETAPNRYGHSARDSKMAALLNDYWAQFARTGDPNRPGLPPWPRLTPDGNALMWFSDDGAQARDDPAAARLDVLDGIFREQSAAW